MPPYLTTPGKTKLRLPRGACDAHFHVFGPVRRFPYAPERGYTPEREAPKETLFALHADLGVERGVVVQSAVHGSDHSAAADLIAARPSAYRGVALVSPRIGEQALEALHAQGFRGA
ncbi:MAG: amidohydrolase family protein, partial [Betaproteobacteria bacterium]|nr:amidohydrolase family protein [Betaproteobacteria bacterium]